MTNESHASVSAISIRDVSFRYGDRLALDRVGFQVPTGSICSLFGPNGSGKSTLFRLLSTLLPIQEGEISIANLDVSRQVDQVRREIGVTFQSPGLDRKLTVAENFRYQGLLYGMSPAQILRVSGELAERLGIQDRLNSRVDSLSGGLARRAEIAKSLLHSPRILLLDEPSTGLDPGARLELWRYLDELRRGNQVTILITTHLMEEGVRADQIGILDQGKLVAWGPPEVLQAEVAAECLTIVVSSEPRDFASRLEKMLGIRTNLLQGGQIRITERSASELVTRIASRFKEEIVSLTWGRASLEDVFIEKTGHQFPSSVGERQQSHEQNEVEDV